MKKIFFLLFIVQCLFFYEKLNGQNQRIVDSLNYLISKTPDDTNKVALLLTLGDEYEKEKPEKAVEYYTQALNIARKTNIKIVVSTCLEFLAIIYKNSFSKFSEAEVFLIECIKIRKEVLGENHPYYATTLFNLSLLYTEMGLYDKAIPLLKEAMSFQKNTLGEEHLNYQYSLQNLGRLYSDLGNFSEAESLYLKTLRLRKDLLGDKSHEYTTTLTMLADLYRPMGRFSEAEVLYKEALQNTKNLFGDHSSDYASLLNSLAVLYKEMGNYSKTEPLLLESNKIIKEVLGEKHNYYSGSLNNLAMFYQVMGNFSKSETLYLESLKLKKEISGSRSADYAISLNNLAGLYFEKGSYAKAEELFKEAMEIRVEIFGKKHPAYAESLVNLGSIYEAQNNFTKAEASFIEALNIKKEKFGEKNQNYAYALNNLAMLYHKMGETQKAEPLFIETIQIRKELLGEKHPLYAVSLNNLARFYKDQKNFIKAEPLYRDALQIQFDIIQSNFAIMSETEKEKFMDNNSRIFNDFKDFAFKYINENPEVANSVYNLSLTINGILLSSDWHIRDEITKSKDTTLIKLFNNWQVLKANIGRYSQWSKSKLVKLNINLDSLEKATNTIEKELSQKSNVFENERKNSLVKWEQVQLKIKKNEAAVEFFTYKPVNKKTLLPNDTVLYCALVLRRDDKNPKMITLCNNYELDDLLRKTKLYSSTILVKGSKPVIQDYIADVTASQQLYYLIWKQLEPLFMGKENIYVSLTGLLHKISFNALMDDKKQLLLNKYNLNFVSSTRQLTEENIVKTVTNKNIALFGGIIYDCDSTQMKVNARNSSGGKSSVIRVPTKDTLRGGKWVYLEGTMREVTEINQVFTKKSWQTKLYAGANATEESYKLLSGQNAPSIIHISTHGFFYPEPDSSTFKKTNNVFKTMKNPLWRSGILFAGANYTWDGNPEPEGVEDGVLTAYEVANGNLQNTDLVVLSACETGLGAIKTGEGVYGLQRSFRVAGAGSVIMSLWQVPDKETTELMILFYENYLKSNSIHNSFRKAQQTMAKKYPPFYWAAFVLVE
ncbi:MAG: tetratricopeptide repeat protein [Bacteroidota bacterium]